MDAAKVKKDHEFEQLVQPLSEMQRRTLEAQILSGVWDEPVYIWHGSILDGQDRFELCCKHEISVEFKELCLRSREDAIVWICVKQGKRPRLGRNTGFVMPRFKRMDPLQRRWIKLSGWSRRCVPISCPVR